ncbi:MAG TPA: cobalamin-dependent protein, partial [Desulfosarcina sp.]|nr:cobalamin-dependent protein [Desulfosarcina sp.]
MKILLVSANTLKVPYPVYPIGLDHVAASLDARHRVRIADLNVTGGVEALVEAIGRFAPDLVGISLRNIDNTDTTDPAGYIGGYRSVVEAVRRTTGAPVVLGGSGFTLFPRQIMRALSADYGIVGEGERLNLLIDALEAGSDPTGLPGIVLDAAAPVELPPPWQGERRARPEGPPGHLAWYLAHGAMLNLQTKRGCPFRCIYCTYP